MERQREQPKAKFQQQARHKNDDDDVRGRKAKGRKSPRRYCKSGLAKTFLSALHQQSRALQYICNNLGAFSQIPTARRSMVLRSYEGAVRFRYWVWDLFCSNQGAQRRWGYISCDVRSKARQLCWKYPIELQRKIRDISQATTLVHSCHVGVSCGSCLRLVDLLCSTWPY